MIPSTCSRKLGMGRQLRRLTPYGAESPLRFSVLAGLRGLAKLSRAKDSEGVKSVEVGLNNEKSSIKKNKPAPTVKTVTEHVDANCGLTRTEKETLFKELPSRYFKSVSSTPTSVYLIDKEAASSFSSCLKSENVDTNIPVLELNAGIGLLTAKLIDDVGFKNVSALEGTAGLFKYLRRRFDISAIPFSFEQFPRLQYQDRLDGGDRVYSTLNMIKSESLKSMDNEGTKPLYVIGTLPHTAMINFILRSYATRRVFFDSDLPWNDIVMFIALGGRPHLQSSATAEQGLVVYRATAVLFQTFFNVKQIGSLPSKAFVPWELEDNSVRTGPRSRKLKIQNPHEYKLIRIEINRENEARIGKDNLFKYWYFVRQHYFARKRRIIPELERWIPGCGSSLIKKGFSIYSQFGDLVPEQVLELYLHFVSLPEFANSSFLSAVEKYITRVEINEDEDHL